MNDEGQVEDLLLTEARIGIEAEQFLRTSVGQYLIGRAELEEREALESLGEVDPENAKAVREAQFRLQVARAVPRWLSDAIQSGRIAQTVIEAEENND